MTKEEIVDLCIKEADETFGLNIYFDGTFLSEEEKAKNFQKAYATNTVRDENPNIYVNDEEIIFYRGTRGEVTLKLDGIDEDEFTELLYSVLEELEAEDDEYLDEEEDEDDYYSEYYEEEYNDDEEFPE